MFYEQLGNKTLFFQRIIAISTVKTTSVFQRKFVEMEDVNQVCKSYISSDKILKWRLCSGCLETFIRFIRLIYYVIIYTFTRQ